MTAELAAECASVRPPALDADAGPRPRRRNIDDLCSGARARRARRRQREISAHENRLLTVELLLQNDTVSQCARSGSHVAPQPVVGAAASRVACAGTGAAREAAAQPQPVVDAVGAVAAARRRRRGRAAARRRHAPRWHAARRDEPPAVYGVGLPVWQPGASLAAPPAAAARTPSRRRRRRRSSRRASSPPAAGRRLHVVYAARGLTPRGAAPLPTAAGCGGAAERASARCGCATWSVDDGAVRAYATRLASPRGRGVRPRRRRVRGAAAARSTASSRRAAAERALRGRRHQARPRAGRPSARAAGVQRDGAARRASGPSASPPAPTAACAPTTLPLRYADGRGRRAIARTRVLLDGGGADGVTSVRALAACQLAFGGAARRGGPRGAARRRRRGRRPAFSLRDGGGCGEARGAPVAAGASIHALASFSGEGGGGARLRGAVRRRMRAALRSRRRARARADGELGGGAAPRRPRCRRVRRWRRRAAAASPSRRARTAPASCGPTTAPAARAPPSTSSPRPRACFGRGSALLDDDDGLVALFSTDGSARRRRPWLPPSLRRRRNRGRPPPARRRRPTTDGRGAGRLCARLARARQAGPVILSAALLVHSTSKF